MFSSEGEEVKLQEVMYPTGNVEDWMSELERIMRETLRLTLKDALEAYPKVRQILFIRQSNIANVIHTTSLSLPWQRMCHNL